MHIRAGIAARSGATARERNVHVTGPGGRGLGGLRGDVMILQGVQALSDPNDGVGDLGIGRVDSKGTQREGERVDNHSSCAIDCISSILRQVSTLRVHAVDSDASGVGDPRDWACSSDACLIGR